MSGNYSAVDKIPRTEKIEIDQKAIEMQSTIQRPLNTCILSNKYYNTCVTWKSHNVSKPVQGENGLEINLFMKKTKKKSLIFQFHKTFCCFFFLLFYGKL